MWIRCNESAVPRENNSFCSKRVRVGNNSSETSERMRLMPNAHRRRRRDETVLSRRRWRCEHEFATSWRQFRRVVGVNTPVGSRDPVYNFLC